MNRRNNIRRRTAPLPRAILPIQSIPLNGSTPVFIPIGHQLVSIKAENTDGPTYSITVNQQNWGTALNIIAWTLVAANGTTCTSPHYHGFMTNVATAPTTLGDQALSLQTDTTTTGVAYYI